MTRPSRRRLGIVSVALLLVVSASAGTVAASAFATGGPGAVSNVTDNNEPNDGFSSATPVSEGRHAGNISAGDTDVFAIDLDAGDVVNATTVFDHSTGDLEIEVYAPDDPDDYDDDPERIEYGFSNTDDERTAFTATRSGTHYFKIFGEDDDTSAPYTLVLDRTTPSEGDAYEPNFDFDSASPIEQGRHPANLQNGERDYYAIDLNAGDVLDTKTVFDHSTGDLEVEVYAPDDPDDYDSEPERIEYGFSNTDDERAAITATRDGTYYVVVSGEDDDTTSAPYTLIANRITPDEGDAYEPNYNFSTAAAVTEGTHDARIEHGEEDYYALSAAAGDVFNVSARFDHAAGDLELEAYAPDDPSDYDDEPERIEYSFTNDDDEQLAFTATQDGTYYVKVSPEDNDLTANDYQLDVDRVRPSENDAYEPNFDFDNASRVTEGSHDAQLVRGEVDIYSVELDPGDVVRATALFDHSAGDLELEAYAPDREDDSDDEPERIEYSFTNDDDEQLAFTATRGGTYYFKLSGEDNDATANAYTFLLNRTEPDEADAYEPNFDFDSAAAVDAESHSAALLPGEKDYYVVGLRADDTLDVTARFDHSLGDLDLAVYGPDGDDRDSEPDHLDESHSNTDDESLVVSADRTGLYYVVVEEDGENDAITTPYELDLSRTVAIESDVTLDVEGGTTAPGDEVTVQFDVTNVRSQSIDSVTLDAGTLPGGWQVASQSAGDAQWDPIELAWGWSSIAAGETKTVTLTLRTPSNAEEDVESITSTLSRDGTTSDLEPVVVTILEDAGETNAPPVADAGTDQSVTEGETVTLDGSDSTDPDGDRLAYEWTQVSGPEVSLADAGTETPTFTAPSVSDEATLQFELAVSDGNGNSDTDTVTVTVTNASDTDGTQSPVEAVAGSDREVSLQEVQEGIQYWASGTAVPGADERLSIQEVQQLIQAWANGQTV